MSDFHPDSVAFVTGAASGIGRAVSERLISDGILKIALLDLSTTHLEPTISSLKSLSSKADILALGVDCSREEQVEDSVKQTVEKFGRIDVAFNAAGISGEPGKTADMTSEQMARVLDLNLKGVWYCQRAEIRQMLRQEERALTTGLPLKTRGAIVNVGSLTSHIGLSNVTPYVMSKHAVLGLTKSDTIDYAGEGIRINAVCPGWIQTQMTKFLWEDSSTMGVLAARAPMNRWGMPEEVAYTVSYLLSDKASFIAGTSITIDGGYLCQ